MRYRQLFFIEGKLLGETPRDQLIRHATFLEPSSELYYCSLCGEVYAKLPCLRADGTTTTWQSHRGMCRKCGVTHQQWYSEFPGSIWQSWDTEYTAALPMPVLRWELERHLDSLERFQNGYK